MRMETLLKELLHYANVVNRDQGYQNACMALPKMIDDIYALNAISREAIVCKFELTELFGHRDLVEDYPQQSPQKCFPIWKGGA